MIFLVNNTLQIPAHFDAPSRRDYDFFCAIRGAKLANSPLFLVFSCVTLFQAIFLLHNFFKRELSLASASSSLYFSFSHLSFCHFNRPKTKILFSKQGPANKSCSNISNLLQLFLARKFKFLFWGANIQIVQIHWSYFWREKSNILNLF